MRKFDSSKLVAVLESLPVEYRVAFAAACAERQRLAYRFFEAQHSRVGPNALECALDDLWANLSSKRSAAELERQIEGAMSVIPQEDTIEGAWTQEATNAQNAGMTVVYALRSRLTTDAKEAAWAAQVAYEALDNFVSNLSGIDAIVPGEDLRTATHPLIQAELSRQERDLHELLSATESAVPEVVERIRERAKIEAPMFFSKAPSSEL